MGWQNGFGYENVYYTIWLYAKEMLIKREEWAHYLQNSPSATHQGRASTLLIKKHDAISQSSWTAQATLCYIHTPKHRHRNIQ